jgi:hypothetical protein
MRTSRSGSGGAASADGQPLGHLFARVGRRGDGEPLPQPFTQPLPARPVRFAGIVVGIVNAAPLVIFSVAQQAGPTFIELHIVSERPGDGDGAVRLLDVLELNGMGKAPANLGSAMAAW